MPTIDELKGKINLLEVVMIDYNSIIRLEFYVGTFQAKFRMDFICSLSEQDYKDIIHELDPDAPARGNPDSLRTMLGSLFASDVAVE